MSDKQQYAVGDVLAFIGSYPGSCPYTLHKIDRITHSGRIICGGLTQTLTCPSGESQGAGGTPFSASAEPRRRSLKRLNGSAPLQG